MTTNDNGTSCINGCDGTNLVSILILIDLWSESIRCGIQYTFDQYMSLFGQSFSSRVFSSMCLTVGVYWSLGSFYTILDLYQWPNFLYQFKTQNYKVTLDEIKTTVKLAFFNQITVQLVVAIIFEYIATWIRPIDSSPHVPELFIIVFHLIVFVIVQEIGFYYLHRLFHHGKIYRFVHKIHHHWQAPIAIASIYCHPLEHLVTNLIPVLAGPILMQSHRSTIAIWLIIVHLITLNDHSGYHFPFMPSPEYHDYHHLAFNQNFGRMGFLDYLHGTNERYLNSIYSKRHQVLFSFTPIKVSLPDSIKNNPYSHKNS
ncbi:Fatty acid hydroxylase domain-containing protein 2 [Sarcoptes scabiei]|uniref:Fatty acid hydroxylase domain-containing protein 2 n=1 Tax=Sarcoptes scabiei TaxID=52283 RepID=A0A834RDI6_SARSC|nr:Fatty acid hydroxylase domain-containing protein 2 [Sarcoptes scabiei]UXI18062.1 hypothetical protein NH340_JMT04005 [Sarcoptes scabiei]